MRRGRWRARGRVVLAFSALLVGASGTARAAENAGSGQATGTLAREYVGFELTPVAIALGTPETLDRYQAGLGLTARVLRHRWRYGYLIPGQAGFYFSQAGGPMGLVYTQIEGGLVVPGTNRRLEIGVGAGLGVLLMSYDNICDGDCWVGGTGLLASFAARYLFFDRPTMTAGAGVRAFFPLTDQRFLGTTFQLQGWGNAILFSLEVGLGRGPRAASPAAGAPPVDNRGQGGQPPPTASDREPVGDSDAEPSATVVH